MTGATGYYRIRFDADPLHLIFFRGGLNAWLHGLQWPEPDRVDVVLAVSEACANAVQHAYTPGEPGAVEVVGHLVVGPAERRIVVVVRDEGRWRDGETGSGLGMRTLHECMAQVRIRHDGPGTVVTMTSRPVPLLGAATGDPATGEQRVARQVGLPLSGPAGGR